MEYNIELKDTISGEGTLTCSSPYYTTKFWFKQQSALENLGDNNLIKVKELSSREPWYPFIYLIEHTVDKEIDGVLKTLHYRMPAFYRQTFYDNTPPLMEVQEESPDSISSNVLQLDNNNIHIYNLVDFTKDGHEFKVPESINIYDDDSNEYTPIDWHVSSGRISTYEKTSNKNVFVDYIYEETYFEYRGYWLDNETFIKLNLNTNPGNTFTMLHPYDEDKDIEIRPALSKEDMGLNNKIIHFYMKPVVGDIEDKTNGVFHTIDERLESSHPFIYDEIQAGEYEFEDVLKIGYIHITPIVDSKNLTYKDTRVRGGGIKEDIIADILDMQEHRPAIYDYDNIDGKPHPENNSIVIELPKEILQDNGGYLSKEEVEDKIDKYIALGNIPIIIYK